jgi:hypothetical protein
MQENYFGQVKKFRIMTKFQFELNFYNELVLKLFKINFDSN